MATWKLELTVLSGRLIVVRWTTYLILFALVLTACTKTARTTPATTIVQPTSSLAGSTTSTEVLGDPLPAPPEGRRPIDQIEISADRRTIILRFVGHAHPEDSPCSEDYEGWARTNGEILEVAVVATREPGQDTEALLICTFGGLRREVVVELSEPFTGSDIRDMTGDFVLSLTAP